MAHSAAPWRSLLFIPADNQNFIAKIHTRGVDACILDLEDSIPPDAKEKARVGLADAADRVSAKGLDVLVRINADSAEQDLSAAVCSAVSAIVLPKVDSAEAVQTAAAILDRLEEVRGIARESIGLIAQIEDVMALPNLDSIATSSARLLGMSLGSEDFSASASMQPTPETLYWPNQQVVFACRRAGISPLGFPASIGLFGDLEALTDAVVRGAQMGFTGAFCIHPAQVAVLNQMFTPDLESVEDARKLLAEFDKAEAENKGVFAWKGKMVDLPVVYRARALVERFESMSCLIDRQTKKIN